MSNIPLVFWVLVQMFKEEFKEIGIEPGDNAIAKITGKSYDPLELIKLFKNENFPNIAVTVDLLTTGIDVPPICNLVFRDLIHYGAIDSLQAFRPVIYYTAEKMYPFYNVGRMYRVKKDFESFFKKL